MLMAELGGMTHAKQTAWFQIDGNRAAVADLGPDLPLLTTCLPDMANKSASRATHISLIDMGN